MSHLKANTAVLIVGISARTIPVLRRQSRIPKELLAALERSLRAFRGKPTSRSRRGVEEERFLTQKELVERTRNHLTEDQETHISGLLRVVGSRLALVHAIPESDDFTFYVARKGGATPEGQGAESRDVIETLLKRKIRTSCDGELWLWDPTARKAACGRVLVCACSKGTRWSVTFRTQKVYPRRGRKAKFFNDFDDIVRILDSTIFSPTLPDEHGLVVIAGRTGSGKSQIARKLIEGYLARRKSSNPDGRTPHLVTFEDPIEGYFQKKAVARADCTQREKPTDARSLKEVLQNALRQTPKVLYVGETRRRQDWKLLLEFAGTGHLVITTAHAGSLVEAVGNLLQETDSSTPATRSIVADRLLAVVHVKSAIDAKREIPFLIPAIWHRTPLGVKTLMAEGLSSLLPNTPPERKTVGGNGTGLPGSVGRYWFARELAKSNRDLKTGDRVKRKALEWDLEGI